MPEELKNCEPSLHLNIVDQILQIPKQIISYHHVNGLVDLVLHNISKNNCLSFSKAAYFVDNPDFNQLKGVCGFNSSILCDTPVKNQQDSIEYILKSAYNCKVKSINRESFRAKNIDLSNRANITELCDSLEIKNPKTLSWDLKHNNYGVLIFETEQPDCCSWKNSLVEQVSHFLGMCAF